MLAGMVGTSAMVTFDPLHNCSSLARQYCAAPRMDASIKLAGDEMNIIVDLLVARTNYTRVVELMCDCRRDIYFIPPTYMLMVQSEGCLLAGRGEIRDTARRQVIEFCQMNNIDLFFNCPFFKINEDLDVELRTW